ncbi:MAG: Holliday junction resolvase RuvX [Arachnia sp.]
MAELVPGSRLGIDWGKARIGVAACGSGTGLAYPVETVPAGRAALGRLVELVTEYDPAVIYLGLPLTLSGDIGIAAIAITEHAQHLAATLGHRQVRLVDERLSTAGASRTLGAAGRSTRRQRTVIDQAAAVEILQRAIDVEAASGALAGVGVGMEES